MQYPTLLISIDTPTEAILTQVIPFSSLENNPDLLWVRPQDGKTSISIDQVHEVVSQLQLKPVREAYKVVLIAPAHLLTIPAQQALLKTLEEPPENTQIILASTFPAQLLPTIRSRCREVHHIVDASKPMEASEKLYEQIRKLRVSECMKLSDTWAKDRSEAIKKLRMLLNEIRTASHERPSAKTLDDEKATITCIEQLGHNTHMKLTLDMLFFRIASHSY